MVDLISGSWHWSGPWLMYDGAIDRDLDLSDVSCGTAPFCPECLSDNTIRLSLYHPQYPYYFYCRNCGLVWYPYAVRCPEHYPRALYNMHCHDCNYTWDEELIREMYEKGW